MRFARSAASLCFALSTWLACGGASVAQAQTYLASATPMTPQWVPVSASSAPAMASSGQAYPMIGAAAPAMMSATAVASVGPTSPYYTDSPRYHPAIQPIVTPPPVVNVQPPLAPPPQTVVAPQAPVAPIPPPVTQAPSGPVTVTTPVSQQPPPAATPPAAAPLSQASPGITGKDAPFVDERVFLGGGRLWREYDISTYTSRFSPADKPEEAVRHWILAETGEQTWLGSEVASLSITPQRVTAYHTPEVQAKLEKLLGRFVYYSPGEFNTRIRVISARHVKWRAEMMSKLRPIGEQQPGREAWLLDRSDTEALLSKLRSNWNGDSLADKEFRIANGQLARGFWPGRNADYLRTVGVDPAYGDNGDVQNLRPLIEQIQDGVHFVLSPLIAQDAAHIDLEVEIKANKVASRKEVRLDAPGHPKVEVPEVATASLKSRYRVPPGKMLLFSLGLLPSIDAKGGIFNLNKDRRDELLLLVEIVPDPANTVAGRTIASRWTDPWVNRPVADSSSNKNPGKSKKHGLFNRASKPKAVAQHPYLDVPPAIP